MLQAGSQQTVHYLPNSQWGYNVYKKEKHVETWWQARKAKSLKQANSIQHSAQTIYVEMA